MKKPEFGNGHTLVFFTGLMILIIFAIPTGLDLIHFGIEYINPFAVICMVIGVVILIAPFVDLHFKENEYYEYISNPNNRIKILEEQKKAAENYQRAVSEKRTQLEAEKEEARLSQKNGAPWERYYTHPCPYCGHYKVRAANWDDKRMSVAFWGVHSQKMGCKYKCDNCTRIQD